MADTLEQIRLVKDYSVFNDREIRENLEIGVIYRPSHLSVMIIEQGSFNFNHNLSNFTVPTNSILFVTSNSAYEFLAFSSDIKLSGISYSRDFLGNNGVHLSSSNILEVFASSFQPFYTVEEADTQLLINIYKMICQIGALDIGIPFHTELSKHTVLSLFYLAASIFRRYNTAHQVKLNRKEELSIAFLNLLAKDFREQRSVQYYAEQLFVSPKHLSHSLKDSTGRTAGEFIDLAVIMEAKIILRNPMLNIAEVAKALHFSDQFFFAKFFKKQTGLTPTQFRSQH